MADAPDITFEQYVAILQEYLKTNPESAKLPVFVQNGYQTSEDYIRMCAEPRTRKLTGRMVRKYPGDVLMLR
jgi:hypothetical protein